MVIAAMGGILAAAAGALAPCRTLHWLHFRELRNARCGCVTRRSHSAACRLPPR